MAKKFERWQAVDKAVAENAPRRRASVAASRRARIAERRDTEVQRRKAAERRNYLARTAELEMNPERIAIALDVEPSTVKRWLSGESRIPLAVVIALEALQGRLPGMDTKAWAGAWINRDGSIGLNGHKKTYRPEQIYMLEYALSCMDGAYESAQQRIRELESDLRAVTQAANDAKMPREHEAPRQWYRLRKKRA